MTAPAADNVAQCPACDLVSGLYTAQFTVFAVICANCGTPFRFDTGSLSDLTPAQREELQVRGYLAVLSKPEDIIVPHTTPDSTSVAPLV